MNKLPKFKDENEEREFWSTHSPLDFPEEFEETDIQFVDKRSTQQKLSKKLVITLDKKYIKLLDDNNIPYQIIENK